jgi:excinuclease ABC subunit B
VGDFHIESSYKPAGDQPQAIDKLVEGLLRSDRFQTLLGVTGSGKTFTMAHVVERVQRPTLVIAHNKTLAAQLCSEFREIFPHNAVEYFVSYYDYYQPEAYIPTTDTYIEKDSSVNDEIDRLRHSATQALLERRDALIVASVSCIYGLGSPEEYMETTLSVNRGACHPRNDCLRKLVNMQFTRNDIELNRGTFRVRGDVLEIQPADEALVHRVEFFGDEVERITVIDPLTGEILEEKDKLVVFPASHFVASQERIDLALQTIEQEMVERVAEFERQGKLLEAQRIEQRTRYDLEMIREFGYCSGIENYSRHMDRREPGSPPNTLLDYFPDDFLCIIDESHQTIPQLHGMYAGDMSRKETLVEFGFRLPSAKDNRPLKWEEFDGRINQAIFVSATPAQFERTQSSQVVEQIIRPTGLVDPVVETRPTKGQIDDLIAEIHETTSKGERVLVTTLTKRMAEDLSEYLQELGVKVHYLHSDVNTLERTEILRDLRLGVYDVIVGINLLREGLDLPEVSLVAILDADKEGFLRSETSLVQTMGRAARNSAGRVLMYADKVTDSMAYALRVTNERRARQTAFNEEHGIVPETIRKQVHDLLLPSQPAGAVAEAHASYSATPDFKSMKPEQAGLLMANLEEEMRRAAKELRFEEAAVLRDRMQELKGAFMEAVTDEELRKEFTAPRKGRPRRAAARR